MTPEPCPLCRAEATQKERSREIAGCVVEGLGYCKCPNCAAIFTTAAQSRRNKQRILVAIPTHTPTEKTP